MKDGLNKSIALRVSEDDLDRVDKFCELHLLDRSGLIRSIIQGLDVESHKTDHEQAVEYMRLIRKNYNREGWFDYWVLGMIASEKWDIVKLNKPKVLDKIMDDAGLTKKQKYRARKKLLELNQVPNFDNFLNE